MYFDQNNNLLFHLSIVKVILNRCEYLRSNRRTRFPHRGCKAHEMAA